MCCTFQKRLAETERRSCAAPVTLRAKSYHKLTLTDECNALHVLPSIATSTKATRLLTYFGVELK